MFGCIVAGRLVQTNLQQVDVNKYIFELSDAPSINHIVVFLLGTIPFEPGFAATVHLRWPNKDWQLLGAISNEKPSAIFRLRQNKGVESEEDSVLMDATGSATIGISIEPIASIEQQLSMQSQTMEATPSTLAMVKSAPSMNQVSAIASRMLENLYNYVTSYVVHNLPVNAIPLGTMTEHGFLPVKTFQTWYENLGRKLSNDPNYLSTIKS